jgi:antitoxin component YwqK of YwqJK toxin-antitoxin module
MRIVLLFFFGIVIGLQPSYSQADINQTDAQGNRHGLWKKLYPGTKQLRYEGVFEHGKEVGTFKFYCETCKDQPSVVKEFNSENSIAEVKYYTVKGKLVSEGKMDGKDRIGEWLYYPKKSSNVMTRENYKNGKLDGLKITYYGNGKIAEERNYVNGLLEGPNNYYSPDGVLLKKLIYKNDVLVGPALYYDASGALTIEGSYKNGKKHGLWKHYKNGKLILEEMYPKPLPVRKN